MGLKGHLILVISIDGKATARWLVRCSRMGALLRGDICEGMWGGTALRDHGLPVPQRIRNEAELRVFGFYSTGMIDRRAGGTSSSEAKTSRPFESLAHFQL